MTVTNNGDIPIKMNKGFGHLFVTNKLFEKDITMWHFGDFDLRDFETGIILMPGASRSIERNLWNEDYFVSGDHEIGFTYSVTSKGKPVYFTSYAQFKII